MNRTKPSRFIAFVSAFALGSSLCFAHTSAWAVCTGDTVINSDVTTTQTQVIESDLCSFTVQNRGGISTTGPGWGVLISDGSIASFSNYGSISTNGIDAHSIFNNFRTITSLKNTGSIIASGSTSNAILNKSDFGFTGTITTLTNTGTISAANGAGILNNGDIGTLNNQQGGSSPLTYSGRLPTDYNIIIRSSTNYGKLQVTSPTNASGTSGITFNIYGQTGTTAVSGVDPSTLAAGTYSGVITGLSASNIASSSLSGTFPGGFGWRLQPTGNGNAPTTWDLEVTAAATQDTLSAVATPNRITVTGTSTLSTSGGSGSGNVTYALVSGPCVLSGATLTGTGAGVCKVEATKAADSDFASARSQQKSILVTLANQASLVVVASPNSITVNGTSTLSTTGGSGSGNVIFQYVYGPCAVSGATLTGRGGVGTCAVVAYKAADSTYAENLSIPLLVDISLPTQAPLVVAASPNSITVNGTSTLSTSGGSGSGNVTYERVSGPCSLSGATLTGRGVGNCVVTATKAADIEFAAATSLPLSIFTAVAPGFEVIGPSTSTATVSGATNLTAGRFTNGSNPPPGKNFLYSVFEFTAQTTPGGSVTVTITYPRALPSNASYMKFINGRWIDWTDQVTVSGNTATYSITDNGDGDSNAADGVITDPFVPVIDVEVAQIPTLSEWAMMFLVSLMGMLGLVRMRRGRRHGIAGDLA